ncbi:MAG: ABC transporter permease [Candidatus Hodarchaeales archaeon]|jgi:tungstate transport system permease protein
MSNELVEAFLQAIELILTLDQEVMQITFLSLRVSLTAVLFATTIGIPSGIILGSREFLGKRFILTLVNTGMSFPPVVMGLLIFLLFSRAGPFGQLGILLTDTAMILAQLLLAIPIITGLSASAVEVLTLEFRETATTLGASQLQYIWLTIREVRTGLLAATIAAFGAAISEIGAIQIVGGNIRFKTRTLTTAIGKEISAGRWELAMALGIILLATAFLVNVIFTYFQHTRKIWAVKGD